MKYKLNSMLLSFALAFSFGVVAYGESPVAIIRLPKEIEEAQQDVVPGDPIDLDGRSSVDAKVFRWKVEPAVLPSGRPTYKVSEDKKTLTLYSREGVYRVTLMVANDEDIADSVRVVVVGKGSSQQKPPAPQEPKVVPVPDTKPPPPEINPTADSPLPEKKLFGLTEIVKASVQKNVPASQRKTAQLLAEAYRHGAESIAKGQWSTATVVGPDGKKKIEVITRQSALNHTVSGYSDEVWAPVFKDVANKLGELIAAGKLSDSRQWALAWSEMSLGFYQSYVASTVEE